MITYFLYAGVTLVNKKQAMGHDTQAAIIGAIASILALSEPHSSTSKYNPISNRAPVGRINGCPILNKAAKTGSLGRAME